ncbi:MAG TPA: hypothetical protein VHT53_09765 [Candidatus Elarobacter sp.]|nr:hypothetical protein [Candidatus Elarobacter sp.]
MNHLDDDAELYALGMTERDRDAEIEAHIAECEACHARVVAAEAAAASLASALPAMPAASRRSAGRAAWTTWGAAAAAVVFAATTALEGTAAHGVSDRLNRTDVALSAIAGSHFAHTTLTSQPGVVAKALYARDGSWCYVVVNGAPAGAHVVLHRDGATVDEGTLDDAAPATLFVRQPGKADSIDVVANGRDVAHGAPVY